MGDAIDWLFSRLLFTDAAQCFFGRCRPALIVTHTIYNGEQEVCERCGRVHSIIWDQL